MCVCVSIYIERERERASACRRERFAPVIIYLVMVSKGKNLSQVSISLLQINKWQLVVTALYR